MKRTILILSVVVALFSACANGPEVTTKPATTTEEANTTNSALANNPDYQKGLQIAASSDCFTCHKIDEQLTGPAYKDIANKYANAGDTIVNYLATKIIKGGNGVWGQVIMTPHPSLSKEDAEALAKYVLLLKN